MCVCVLWYILMYVCMYVYFVIYKLCCVCIRICKLCMWYMLYACMLHVYLSFATEFKSLLEFTYICSYINAYIPECTYMQL
jgi:hypothetical protein